MRIKSLVLLTAAAFALSACGGEGGGGGSGMAPDASGAFFASVAAIAAAPVEDSDAVSIDAVTVGTSDTAGPAAI